MAGQPLQRDLPGLLRLGGLLKIEDMAPASNHDKFHVPAQRRQPCRQAPGLLYGGRAILVAVDQQHRNLYALRLVQR